MKKRIKDKILKQYNDAWRRYNKYTREYQDAKNPEVANRLKENWQFESDYIDGLEDTLWFMGYEIVKDGEEAIDIVECEDDE